MVVSHDIEVVMPTYNGFSFVENQIKSIYNQTIRPIRIIVRDDDSTDGTKELLLHLKSVYKSWLHILPSSHNVGCTSSINILLAVTTAPYIALSDQDDIWLENKLELSIIEMKRLESCYSKIRPILIHSDLKLVDAELNDLNINYTGKQLLDPNKISSSQISLTNIVTGCTILMNRSLLLRALPIPSEAIVHDWWIALVASCFGNISFLRSSPILYRQHSSNQIGAKGFGLNYWLYRFFDWLKNPKTGGHSLDAIRQIECFEQRYDVVISILPRLLKVNKLQRIKLLCTSSISSWPRKHGFLRTIAFYFWLLRF